MREPRQKSFNVLFLCTGNSARSIMAEAIMNRVGAGKFRGLFGAEASPRAHVHPYALDLLRKLNYDVSGFRSKSWSEFASPARRSSISSSRSATTRPPRRARSGRASR